MLRPTKAPKEKRRLDYKPTDFLIDKVNLDFKLHPEETVVSRERDTETDRDRETHTRPDRSTSSPPMQRQRETVSLSSVSSFVC